MAWIRREAFRPLSAWMLVEQNDSVDIDGVLGPFLFSFLFRRV